MTRLAGYVFDAYDDVDGRILRSFAPSAEALPGFVKTAARLSEDQFKTTPDDGFALILVDNGAKFRKYATVDKGNTALSIAYLLKQAHLLPPAAVKIAASNLIGACEQYGLSVPEQLKTAAKTGFSPVSGKSQKAYAKGAKVLHIPFPSTEVPNEFEDNPRLGHHDAANADVDQRTNMQSVQGTNMLEVPPFPQKERVKTAGVMDGVVESNPTGGMVMTGYGPRLKAPKLNKVAENGTRVGRQQSWRESPYVDMSGWDPAQVEAFEAAPAQRTLIGGQYPVDGYDQVKTASVYFEENWRELHPRRRHEYCIGLVEQMEKLGMAVPEDIGRYGSSTYAADAAAYVEARRSYVHEEFKPALDLLLEKRAQVGPETFAEALAEFDHMSGLRYHWDAQVADPWKSTFGPSLEKLAEDEWRYDENGTRTTLQELKYLALNGQPELCKQFGKDFAKEFAKNPKTVFESLPDPNKRVLARMSAQSAEGR